MFGNSLKTAAAILCLSAAFSARAVAAPSDLALLPPDYGSGAGGAVVTIQGKGMSTEGVTQVLFGQTEATEVLVTDAGDGSQTLTCTTPAHHGGLCDVTVINPDSSSAKIANAYVFVPTSLDPSVTGALPCASPTTGGKTVFVVGQQAGLPFNSYTLTVGGTPITDVREYRVPGCIPLYSGLSPAHAAGLFGFGVLGSFELLIADCFIYSDSTGPLILRCLPATDWDVGGAKVHIIAANLSLEELPTVEFGGVSATDVVVHPDFGGYISCTAPPHAAGTVDVVVTNPDMQSDTLVGAFGYRQTYTPVPLSITPSQGMGFQRNPVTITGTGFSTIGKTRVLFGDVEALDMPFGGRTRVVNETTLSCYSPVHDPGTVDVTVINPGGASGTLTNSFTFLPPLVPVPTAITPNTGQEAGGTWVTITGADFSTTGSVTVSFGEKRVYNVPVTDLGNGTCQITCMTPSHASGVVDVVVTNPGDAKGTLADGFTYFPQPPPAPASVTPGEGTSLGGTQVTITGTGFNPNANTRVSFGGELATSVSVKDDSTLTCVTPLHGAGVVDVTVISAGDITGVLSGGFTFVEAPAPTVDALSVAEGPTNGGTLVNITGTGFGYSIGPKIKVLFDGIEAFNSYASNSTSIQCYSPVHAPGTVDVTVVNPDGKSGTLPGAFTYVDAAPPTLSYLAPDRGLTLGGTTVIITGTDFCSFYGAKSRVLFGGIEATNVSVWTDYSIRCQSPPHAPGKVDVMVVNPDGKTGVFVRGFTYLSKMTPTISSLSMTMGYATGGLGVNIRGTDFSESGTTRVTFGGVDVHDVRVVSMGDGTLEIQCVTPPHAPGAVDVMVFNPGGGTANLANGFTYVLGPPPQIAHLSISEGPTAGGTPVFVTGANFATVGLVRVTFGGVDATEVNIFDDERLFCVSPPHSSGPVEVAVINSDGQSEARFNGFTYRDPGNVIARVDVDNVSGTEDGATWETAFTSIQAGINAVKASGEPGEVWVAEGTYMAAGDAVVVMESFCDLYGGFAGTEMSRGQRDIKAHVSTIDGESLRACVYGADNARLDGFTLTRGNGPSCADPVTLSSLSSIGYVYRDLDHCVALDNSGTSPTVAHCTITNSNAGIAVVANLTGMQTPTSPLLEDCVIMDCPQSLCSVLNMDGAGSISHARMKNCTIANNNDGVYTLSLFGPCNSMIQGCAFSANKGMVLVNGSMGTRVASRVENCLFTGNKSWVFFVSGMLGGSGFDVVNSTFAGNPSSRDIIAGADGLYLSTFTNCIFWGNGGALVSTNTTVEVSHSNIEGGYPGTGNIDADPLFMDAAVGNFQLRPGSPCVDSGTSANAPTVDLLGAPRPQRAGFDMGAYELADPVPAPDVVGQTRELAAETLTGAGFAVGSVTQQYSLTVPVGTVIAQSPEAGASVQPGSVVDMVVSRGGIAVPEVTGRPQSTAAAALSGSILVVGAVTLEYSATVPAGTVISQTPAAGTEVLPAAAVNLVVSLGVAPTVMPDLVGQPGAQAESVLAQAGLLLGSVVQDYSESVAAGSVAAQSPAPGTALPPGMVVGIVVSLGPAPLVVGPGEGEGEGEPMDPGKLQQLLADAHASADADGDGRLSFDEAAAAVAGLSQAMFDGLDADADGQLSAEELGVDGESGWWGCRGRKGAVTSADYGKRLEDLFVLALGALGLAAMSLLRRP